MNTYCPKPADLLFTHNESFIGRAIRWFTRRTGEAPTYANHVAGLIPRRHAHMLMSDLVLAGRHGLAGELAWKLDQYPGEVWWVLEALWTVTITPLSEYRGDYQAWRMDRARPEDRYRVCAAARAYYGRKYGVLKIGAHAGDAGISKVVGRDVYLFRRLACMDGYPICSWLWAYAYARGIGYEAWGDPGLVSPDCMHDHVSTSSDWVRVM
jgi:hypothetical protein